MIRSNEACQCAQLLFRLWFFWPTNTQLKKSEWFLYAFSLPFDFECINNENITRIIIFNQHSNIYYAFDFCRKNWNWKSLALLNSNSVRDSAAFVTEIPHPVGASHSWFRTIRKYEENHNNDYEKSQIKCGLRFFEHTIALRSHSIFEIFLSVFFYFVLFCLPISLHS